jgi:hypothetical protein
MWMGVAMQKLQLLHLGPDLPAFLLSQSAMFLVRFQLQMWLWELQVLLL